ncbi:MAG: SIMPL domain-containing protein [Flavobacteriaceae bacterium]
MKNISTAIILFSSMIMQAQVPPKATVDVSGEGTVKVVPDQVSITVRVESNGKNPKEVKQLNDQTVNEVFAFLRVSGIPEKNIRSEYINLTKNYDYNSKTYQYVANQSIRIFLEDLSKYEMLMNGLLETGINRIDTVQFLSSKEASLQSEARQKAILNAKMKAEEYVAALGQAIGKAVHISEFQNVSVPSPYLRSAVLDSSNSKMQTMAPGEMEIQVQVNVSFELL